MLSEYRRILVTGGAGFIGSHLVDALVALGKEVVVYDRLSTGSEKNLPTQVTVARGDVRDQAQVAESMKGADLVFHLAANANGTRSIDDPRFDFETNAMGTFNVAEAALEAGVSKLVYMSSASVALLGTSPWERTTRLSPSCPTALPSWRRKPSAAHSSTPSGCRW